MKFKNCKYDHLQLAERFLLAAEKLMSHAKEEINMAAGYLPVNRDQGYAEHFGFDSGESFLKWVIKEDGIWGTMFTRRILDAMKLTPIASAPLSNVI